MYFYFREKEVIANNVETGSVAGEVQGEVFYVEKILDKRTRNNVVEYFLKWIDYDENYNTWEPEKNLDCKELIKDFEQKLQQENNEKKKEKFKRACKRTLSNSIVTNCASSDAGPSGTSGTPSTAGTAGTSGSSKTRMNTIFPQTKVKVKEVVNVNDNKNSVSAGVINGISIPTPIERIVEKIIGATKDCGQLMFLIKWEGIDEATLVPATEANVKWPQNIINFFLE